MKITNRDLDLHQLVRRWLPGCQDVTIHPVSSLWGFSGAWLWRVSTPLGSWCLRRWPRNGPDRQRLCWIHKLLARVYRAGVPMVPVPVADATGATLCWQQGGWWQLEPWMPGTASYWEEPSAARLAAAMKALATLHVALALVEPGPSGPAPALKRRLAALQAWNQELPRLQHRVQADPGSAMKNRAVTVLKIFRQWSGPLGNQLQSGTIVSVPLQPAVCDIWHRHVLFTGEEVTGLIDFGAMQLDSVACDIARLLGSMVRQGKGEWRQGLEAYESVRPLRDEERLLVPVLDRATLLLGAMNWLGWWYLQRRPLSDWSQGLARLDQILERLKPLSDAPPHAAGSP